MSKKDLQTKDLSIENETIKVGEQSATISVIKLPVDNKKNKAFRVYGANNEVVFYRSTRLDTLTKTDNGLKADVTGFEKEIGGKVYDVREVETKDVVLVGKILMKAAAAENVVNINSDKKVGNG